ncbi:N-acetylneuraminate (7)9-O-acetyltransferase isoform X3 [Dermacentor albipictus]|uniref:N-acetylneuraminate (7)9-O-acetyltransferase isoform X3 n=1 Tax=Dermacentor albipictus TaxID=60249 RepID=UPI0031FD9C3B
MELRLNMSHGIDTCKWLLSDGRFQGYHVWQPYGCMLHTYTNAESRMCLRYIAYWGGKNHIVFVGDSRIRQLYWAFVQQVQPSPVSAPQQAHRDLRYEEKDLHLIVEFLWRPLMDGSLRSAGARWLQRAQRPALIVLGSGTWAIKQSNGSRAMLAEYAANVSRLVPLFDRLANGSRVLWMLQDPVQADRLSPSRQAISNELIDAYNQAAVHALRHSSVEIWSSIRLISEGYPGDSPDGLHTGPLAVNYAIQILTNMYCNDHMNYNDGTCCSSPEPITWLQTITFTSFAIVLLLSLALEVRQHMWPTSDYSPLQSVLQQLSRLGLIMAYFFVCDRTNFFMRENKYYTHLNFFLPVAYVFALGLFFTEETQQTQVLHRDQTDEWKGWMQLVLLVYHMTGASQVLPVYVHVRALVSAYLFLVGYGHFSYFWHQADFGLLRLARVLFRTNLLVVLLCLGMNRPYQFYYFVPLVSFWFLVVAATLGSLPRVSAASAEANPLHHLYVVLKFVGLFSVLTVLYMSEIAVFGSSLSPSSTCATSTSLSNFLLDPPPQAADNSLDYLSMEDVIIFTPVSSGTRTLPPAAALQRSDLSNWHQQGASSGHGRAATMRSLLSSPFCFLVQVFFEKIFVTRPWKALFVTTDDSIKEWWFRWKIDRYSVASGMLFGFAHYLLRQYRVIGDHHHGNLFSRGLSLTVAFGALLGLGITFKIRRVAMRSHSKGRGGDARTGGRGQFYTTFAFVCRSKPDCNEVHAYVSFVPILSYIILRNISGLLRTRYSTFFAWFGKISLELFIAQYHIWLAADTHGVLVLVPGYPVLNVMVTSLVLVCVAHEVHVLTARLMPLAVPADWKYLVRNVVIFGLLLVPIGVHDGMF